MLRCGLCFVVVVSREEPFERRTGLANWPESGFFSCDRLWCGYFGWLPGTTAPCISRIPYTRVHIRWEHFRGLGLPIWPLIIPSPALVRRRSPLSRSCKLVPNLAHTQDLLGPTFAFAGDLAYVPEGAASLRPQINPAECWLAGDVLYDCCASDLKKDCDFYFR